jgi:WD40 repeat protein
VLRTDADPAQASAAAPHPLGEELGDEQRRRDWGDAPATLEFVGRTRELSTARDWAVHEHCRLIGVFGMGGIGKTSVVAKLAQEVAPSFERVYWRGLRNLEPLAEWLAGAIGFLSGQPVVPAGKPADQLAALLQQLREQRCLIVLDNFETLLEPRRREGQYRDGFGGYGAVLQAVAETSHESCLMLTSREAPPDWTIYDGIGVHTLELGGLTVHEGQVLLAQKDLSGDTADWARLIDHYGGNSLALKVVGESIRQVFGGDIAAFLAESGSGTVFGGIRRLLTEQFERISSIEQDVLRVLAIGREPLTIADIIAEMGRRVGRGAIVEALEALRHRSLVERAESPGPAAFTLQSVILEFVTDQVVAIACDEVVRRDPVLLRELPLIQAHAREYVRQSQERLVGEPILQLLQKQFGHGEAEQALLALLADWQTRDTAEHRYGPGNVVNLLRLLVGNLRNVNLAGLGLRQTYLIGVEAQGMSLANAILEQTVLTETFKFPVSIAVSADGRFLMAGTYGGEVCLWRVADRTPLLVLQGHYGPVRGAAIAGDGTIMASASEDGTVRLWESPSGRALGVLTEHTSPQYCVALSSDARLAASGGLDGTVRIWEVSSGGLVATLDGKGRGIESLALSADSRLLACGCLDGTVGVWDVKTAERVATLDGQGGSVWSVKFTANGQMLATGAEDGVVRLWELTSRRLLATLHGHTGSVRGVALSTDDRLLASASWDRTLRLWQISDGQSVAVLEGHSAPVMGVALSGDGRLLASGGLDVSVQLWETTTRRPLAKLEGHTSAVYGVALSADGALLASGNWDGSVQLWDVQYGRRLWTLLGHTSPVYGVALSADGEFVASGSWDRTMRIWRVSSGQIQATLKGHTGGVRSVALSADGTLLASGSWDQTVRLWQSPEGRPIATLHGHTGGVRSVAMTADRKLLATGALDGTVWVWQLPEGIPLTTLQASPNPVYCVALSHDGRWLASGGADATLHIWDVPDGKLHATLRGHTGEIRAVALSGDGSLLASGGFDGTVRLWRVAEGRSVATLHGHASPVYGIAMTSDGRLIASGGFDGTVRVWDAASGASRRTLRSDRPFERVDITGLTGVTEAQYMALLTLGAIDRSQSAGGQRG